MYLPFCVSVQWIYIASGTRFVQNAEDYLRKCFPTEKSETVGQCADLCFNLFLQDSVLCNMSKPDRTTRASQHSLLKVASSETRDAEPAL